MFVLYSAKQQLYLTQVGPLLVGVSPRKNDAATFTTKPKALRWRDRALREARTRQLFVALEVNDKHTTHLLRSGTSESTVRRTKQRNATTS